MQSPGPSTSAPISASKSTEVTVLQPEAEAMFLSHLKEIHPSSVVFSSLIARKCTVENDSRKLPPLLTSLHTTKCTTMTEEELIMACQDAFVNKLEITPDEALYLEESTRLQSQSILWHQHRIGRITASKFFAVVRTSIDSPSPSLIKDLMEMKVQSRKTVPALQWGVENEPKAREQYIEIIQEEHEKFVCTLSGLCVNPKYPHLGATPDGIVKCECCGKGLIEIKCPYKYNKTHPHGVKDSKFCLQHDNGKVQLKMSHEYYYQIQGQLAVCELEYCDFICWTPLGIHIECILADRELFNGTIKPALDAFFTNVLLPLLLTGRTHQEQSGSSQLLEQDSYCWCNGGEEGTMVACDNKNCPRQWFHFECVGLTSKPRGKWYCSAVCRCDK